MSIFPSSRWKHIWRQPGKCLHRKDKIKTVDHLTSQCENIMKLLNVFIYYYVTWKIKAKMTVFNNDTRVAISIKIETSKPDILVIDKKNKIIIIIETKKKT